MKTRLIALLFVAMFFMTGCYLNADVQTNQMGVELYKNEIQRVVGPGVYTAWTCYYCDISTVNVNTLTFSVEDPEVLTKDNQAVGVKITIQARRKNDDASIKNIFTNWSALVDDGAFTSTISATAREGMKNGTRNYTLSELLDDRNGLAGKISEAVEADASKYSAEIINVTIENIAPSPSYMQILSDTANIKAETDKEKRRQDLINQKAANDILEQEQSVKVANAQVLAEQAKTDVQVEIAQRQGKVVAAQNQVYVDNPQAYHLKELELVSQILGNKSVIYLPSDVVINLLSGSLNGTNVVPLPATQP